MTKKLMLLAAGALAALAFAALPSAAMAGEWECETSPGGANCGVFTGTNNTVTTLTEDQGNFGSVTCKKNESRGEYTSKTTAVNVTITFSECSSPVGECKSGTTAGVIKTEDLVTHNVMLEATGVEGFLKGTPGVLITPNATTGLFAKFVCGSGILAATIEVKGNGLMGDVTKECGSETAANGNIALDFESVATGTQKWTQVTTAGTKFDLTSTVTPSFGEKTTKTASQDGEGSIHFAKATKITCL